MTDDLMSLIGDPFPADPRQPGEPVPPRRLRKVLDAFMILSAFGSIYVCGLFAGYTGISRNWFINALIVTPLLDITVAIVASLAAMMILIAVCARGHRRYLIKAFLTPVGNMLGVLAGLVGALAFTALALFLGFLGLRWLWGLGGASAVLLAAVYVFFVGYLVVMLSLYLLGTAWSHARLSIRSWFGGASAHPLLPSFSLLAFAVTQCSLGVYALLSGKAEAASLTGVVLAVYLGVPACLAVLALIEARVVIRAGARFRRL